MNKIHIVAIIIVVISLTLFGSTQLLQELGGEFFVVDVLGERFVIQVTDSETIR
ncbi:MAG: hypothetical protein HY619_01140 [Thaumarchaeota archaeon]|nr:hypothetical protein [Nitrososphaerota archaeon]